MKNEKDLNLELTNAELTNVELTDEQLMNITGGFRSIGSWNFKWNFRILYAAGVRW